MRSLAFHVSVFACLVPSAAMSADDAIFQEYRELVGDWTSVETEYEGQKDKGPHRDIWKFRGPKLVIEMKGQAQEYAVKINAEKVPKEMDLVIEEGSLKGHRKKGIYRVQNGRLTFCAAFATPMHDPARPTEFATAKGKLIYLSTLERIEKAP